MSGTARVTIDAARVSPSKALRMAAKSAPLVVITARAYGEIADECGSYDRAARRLLSIATDAGRPIRVNAPTGPETSTTAFVAPKGWSQERLAGWAAGHHEELERAFGPASVRRWAEE